MNATAAHERDDLNLADRIAALEADRSLHLALLHVLSARVSELEGLAEPHDDVDGLTTVKRAAGESGFSETTIRRWLAEGKIEGRRFGGRVMVRTTPAAK